MVDFRSSHLSRCSDRRSRWVDCLVLIARPLRGGHKKGKEEGGFIASPPSPFCFAIKRRWEMGKTRGGGRTICLRLFSVSVFFFPPFRRFHFALYSFFSFSIFFLFREKRKVECISFLSPLSPVMVLVRVCVERERGRGREGERNAGGCTQGGETRLNSFVAGR